MSQKSIASARPANLSQAKSLTKALDILELFSKHADLGTREIARLTAYDRSTIHRILVTLQKHGYLIQAPETKKFRLGMKLLELGTLAVRRYSLRDDARQVMRTLARDLNESVYLLVEEDNAAICIDEVLVDRTLSIGPSLGVATPIHAAAAGKCFLAYKAPEAGRQLIFTRGLAPITTRTIVDPQTFLAELDKVRAQGYALNNEESEIGVRYLAVPIFGHHDTVVAALNVGAPVVRLTDDKIEFVAIRMQQAAAEISRQAGRTLPAEAARATLSAA